VLLVRLAYDVCASDRDAEGPQERGQLRRDAEDGAGDDADDGVKQATNDGKTHENTSLSAVAELWKLWLVPLPQPTAAEEN
jgi:hypothetical protein